MRNLPKLLFQRVVVVSLGIVLQILFAVAGMNWLREYCAQNNVPLYGSYDPECIDGLEETDFFDGLHCAGTGIARFFPGIPQALQQLETGTLPDPLAVHPRTSLESADPDVVETLNGETAETAQEG